MATTVTTRTEIEVPGLGTVILAAGERVPKKLEPLYREQHPAAAEPAASRPARKSSAPDTSAS